MDAFPLAWPVGWPRAKAPRTALYRVTAQEALQHLIAELRLLHARDVVISTNIPVRRDGLPRLSDGEPRDRGVAVYWTNDSGRAQRPMVCACDTWDSVRANIRAIGLTVAALRAIERTGASQLLERAYTGFAALPAQAGAANDWRRVLGFEPADVPRVADVKRAFQQRTLRAHPDHGGSQAEWLELKTAYEAACRELEQVNLARAGVRP